MCGVGALFTKSMKLTGQGAASTGAGSTGEGGYLCFAYGRDETELGACPVAFNSR
jgi:hypothetical protein